MKMKNRKVTSGVGVVYFKYLAQTYPSTWYIKRLYLDFQILHEI